MRIIPHPILYIHNAKLVNGLILISIFKKYPTVIIGIYFPNSTTLKRKDGNNIKGIENAIARIPFFIIKWIQKTHETRKKLPRHDIRKKGKHIIHEFVNP